MTDVLIKFLVIHHNSLNHLTICKRMILGSFKNVYKMCLQIIYFICIENLALGTSGGVTVSKLD